MGVYSISDSALAGLQIAQAGILVTSQNVAGTTVDGYSRRSANAVINQMAPNSLMLNGTSFAVEGFTRQYSNLIGSQLLSQQARSTYTDTLVQYTASLDKLISTKSVGLTTALTDFFNAMGTYATDPSNKALAAGITGKANIVAQRMNGLSEIVSQIKSQAQTGLEDTISQVNTLIPALTEVNLRIENGTNPGVSTASADLFDERDRLLASLQKLVGGQSLINSNGTATHMVGGLALVERGVGNKVSVNADQEHIALQFNAHNGQSKTVLQSVQSLSGGQAGGLLKLANEFAPSIQNRLDTIALSLVKVANSASDTDGYGAPRTKIFGFQVGQNQYYDLSSDYTSLIPEITSETSMTDLYSSLTNAVSTTSNLTTGASLINDYEVATVTFSDLTDGETVSFGGLTFTASGEVSASEVASIFSNASVGRVNGAVLDGVEFDGLGTLDGTLSGWDIGSYSASNAQVTFTAVDTGDVTNLLNSPIDIHESAVVTFSDLTDGETVTFDGLTFEATGVVTASKVASIFANAYSGRSASTSVISETYADLGVLSGTLSNWSIDSYNSDDAQVTFTAVNSENVDDLVDSGVAANVVTINITESSYSSDGVVVDTTASRDVNVTSIRAGSNVAAGNYSLSMVGADELQMQGSDGKTQTISLSNILAGESTTLDFYQFGIAIDLENVSSSKVSTAAEIVDALDGRSITLSGSQNPVHYFGLNAQNFVSLAPSDPAYYYDGSNPNISSDSANIVQKMSSIFGITVSSLVNDVGIQVATWTNTQKADEAVLASLKNQRDSISGVNLDEEAANLLKYQQLYSASTKVMQTGNQMFNTLLSIMN
jgi:flagellar hook-associated protein FlgK